MGREAGGLSSADTLVAKSVRSSPDFPQLRRSHSSPPSRPSQKLGLPDVSSTNIPVPQLQLLSARSPQASQLYTPELVPRSTLLQAPSAAPSRGGVGASTQWNQHFTPELVVPENCECTLHVPLRPLHLGAFDVSDPSGSPVVRAAPKWRAHEANSRPSLVLTTPDCYLTLAQCGRARADDPASGFELLLPSGERYAVLVRNQSEDRYALTTVTGRRLHFWGCLDRHAMTVTDEDSTLVATTDADDASNGSMTHPAYELHVAPLMDVGLILAAALCMDHLA